MECGVWRYHPTRKTFEVVMHGGTNPWGLDWNAEGEAFVTNCVIGHLFHVIPGAHYQRMFGQDLNPYAYELMPPTSEHLHWQGGDWTKARGGESNDALGGGHAHSGAIFMLGEQWPAEMRGDILMCNIHGTRINRDHLDKTSTGYVGRYRPDLINWNDPWFRGVGFAAGPDGSIFVADWCDIGECHDYKEVHRNSGRIYKFWHGELKKWKPEDLEAAKKEPSNVDPSTDPWTARRVVQHFYQHHKDYTDSDAMRILQSFDKSASFQANQNGFSYFNGIARTFGIERFITGDQKTRDEIRQKHLLRSFDKDKEKPEYLKKIPVIELLTALEINFDTRKGDWKLEDNFIALVSKIEYGRVLLAILGDLPNATLQNRKDLLQRLWQNPIWIKTPPTKEDNYGEWAARRNLQCMTWYAMEPVVAADPKWAVAQLLACPDPFLHALILRRLTDEKDNAKLAANLTTLFDNRDVWTNKDRVYELLAALQSGLAGRKKLSLPKPWPALAEVLQSHPDPRVRMQALELSYQFGDPAITPVLLKNVGDAKKSPAERERALQLLARGQDAKLAAQLPSLLDDATLRATAIRALGMYELPNTPQLLLAHYDKWDSGLKLSAVETLASRKPWAAALLTALDQKKLPRADVPSYIARQIELFKDEDLSKQLREGWGMVRNSTEATKKRKQELKTQLTADALKAANHAAGKTLFTENCAKCHKLFGEGAAVGPELTGAQRGNLDYLLENILEPSASVARDYRLSVITLNDGRVLSGVVLEQNAATVKLRTTDSDQTISITDIDELTTTNQSAMPEGILERFDAKQIRDLFGYLQGSK